MRDEWRHSATFFFSAFASLFPSFVFALPQVLVQFAPSLLVAFRPDSFLPKSPLHLWSLLPTASSFHHPRASPSNPFLPPRSPPASSASFALRVEMVPRPNRHLNFFLHHTSAFQAKSTLVVELTGSAVRTAPLSPPPPPPVALNCPPPFLFLLRPCLQHGTLPPP